MSASRRERAGSYVAPIFWMIEASLTKKNMYCSKYEAEAHSIVHEYVESSTSIKLCGLLSSTI